MPPPEPPRPAPRPGRRHWRLVLRWCRLAALCLFLALLLGAAYLHQVGLPEPLKSLVTGAALERGLPLEFDRLRLHWYHGLVADGVRARLPGSPPSLELTFRQVVLNLHWSALLRQQFQLHTLDLHQGRLVAALHDPGEPDEELTFDLETARLVMAANHTWTLQDLRARLNHWSLTAQGVITNGPALPRWLRPPARPPAEPPPPVPPWRAHLRHVKRQLDQLHFVTPPTLQFSFAGDARDLASFRSELLGQAGGALTPWGRWRQLDFLARANPATNHPSSQQLELRLDLGTAETPWGTLHNAHLAATGLQPFTNTLPTRLDWELQARQLRTPRLGLQHTRLQGQTVRTDPAHDLYTSRLTLRADHADGHWGTCAGLSAEGQLTHALTDLQLRSLEARLDLTSLESPPLTLAAADLTLTLRRPPLPNSPPPDTPSPWPWLDPFEARFALHTRDLRTPQIRTDTLALTGHWHFPTLTLTNLHARLYDGDLALDQLHLDVLTRDVRAHLTVDFDIQRLDQALPPGALEWLAQFQYHTPPHADVTVRTRLPPRDQAPTDAGADLLDALDLRVRLEGRQVSFRGLPADEAGVLLTISNRILRLRDLYFLRPEGRADLTYDLDLRRRDFRWRFHAQVDPPTAAPAIDSSLTPILALFHFPSPPTITGEVWGNWNPPKTVDLDLHITTAPFTFRDQPFTSLTARLGKTNEVLTATDVRLLHETGSVVAAQVQYDLDHGLVSLAPARAHLDPLRAAACLGPDLVATLEPYHFALPPEVLVQGHVPTRGGFAGADLVFTVTGGPFRFWRFNSDRVHGTVRWTGHRVTVTNFNSEFYGGRLFGEFLLDLPENQDPPFQFQARASDFDLQALLRDTLSLTNHIEGTVTGTLVVTNAQISDWQSWSGYGQARLDEGLLWDLPLFGALSRFLNLVVPGIGNSRATAAQTRYTITRSVIHTDNLDITAGPAQLRFQGTVDFDGQLDARVVAEVLRKTPVVGPLLSLVFAPAAKALEFRITGHLADPQLKPVYVPAFVLPLLNPLGTLQDLVTPRPNGPDRRSP